MKNRTQQSSSGSQLQLAIQHHQAGRLREAEAIYKKMPQNPDALHLLGVIAYQTGEYDLAVERIKKALRSKQSDAPFHCNLGLAYHALNKLDEAIACYRKALSLMPRYAEAYNNLAGALHAKGKLDEAAECYRKSLTIRPNDAGALGNMAAVLKDQGKLDDAAASCLQALALDPNLVEAHINLGTIHVKQGKLDDAIASFHRALAIDPNNAVALSNLGNALYEQGKFSEAIGYCERAVALKPDHAPAYNNLGTALMLQGRVDEAVACFNRALSLKPDLASAGGNLASALQAYGKRDEALEACRQALARDPMDAATYTNLLLIMQYSTTLTPAEVFAEHLRFAERFETPLKAFWRSHTNPRTPDRRLKIGYVSGDFRQHAVACFIQPLLSHHDRSAFEVFCYYNHTLQDHVTTIIQGMADHWIPCAGMNDDQLAERIREDGIDILVDLSGHTARNRLLTFARKPAPVQITYLGYPGTSGLAAMDYRITDRYADPDGSEQYYQEKLLYLPDSLCCYRPADGMPDVTPLPALQNGYVTFGSFNNVNKIDDNCIKLWSVLLRSIPSSRLLMVTVPEGEKRQRLVEQFGSHGIAADRLDFLGKLQPHEFHNALREADIALDPLLVTGGTTTCESLWMGVPVIVLVGKRYITRVGYSFLSAAGLQDFAAKTVDDYIKIPAYLANNIDLLASLRSNLRSHIAASPLRDEARLAANVENLYRDVWKTWCQGQA